MIMHQLQERRVVLISQDSFYRGLTPEEHNNVQDYNFDHPNAMDHTAIMQVRVSRLICATRPRVWLSPARFARAYAGARAAISAGTASASRGKNAAPLPASPWGVAPASCRVAPPRHPGFFPPHSQLSHAIPPPPPPSPLPVRPRVRSA